MLKELLLLLIRVELIGLKLVRSLIELGTTPKLSTDTELRMATVSTNNEFESPILVIVLSMFNVVINLFLFYDAMVKDLRS